MVVFNRTQGRPVADRVSKADTPIARAVGLLSRATLAPDEGLWIVPCAMIHTFFMKFAIDVVFLDKESKVVHVSEGIAPWRFSRWVFSAHSVLELAGGSLKGAVRPGDELEFKP